MAIFGIINLCLVLGLIGAGIYSFILFVKVANKAIIALDIYINKNTNNKS